MLPGGQNWTEGLSKQLSKIRIIFTLKMKLNNTSKVTELTITAMSYQVALNPGV